MEICSPPSLTHEYSTIKMPINVLAVTVIGSHCQVAFMLSRLLELQIDPSAYLFKRCLFYCVLDGGEARTCCSAQDGGTRATLESFSVHRVGSRDRTQAPEHGGNCWPVCFNVSLSGMKPGCWLNILKFTSIDQTCSEASLGKGPALFKKVSGVTLSFGTDSASLLSSF